MRFFRYITYFIAIVSLAFGLTACQQDSTGPVSKDTAKQQTDQNVKKETTGKKADSTQKADQDKKTDQQRKSAESKKNRDHNKSERSKTTSRQDHTKSDATTVKQNNAKTAASKRPSDGTSGHHASSPKKSSKQQKGTSHKQTNNSHVTSHRSSTAAANHQAKKQTPNPKPTEHQNAAETVTVSIIGHHNQTIVSPTKVPIKKGESMLDATLHILKERGIQYSVRGSGSSAYVEGINNLYEFDDGPLSGWLAKKNGKSIKQSAGVTSVNDGDAIQWIYTTNYKK